MCGIAGIVGRSSQLTPPREWLSTMANKMSHRGPDGEGIAIFERCGFTHRRLAIVDLTETGAQPMTSQDGRVSITYNGELYNDPELRRYLKSKGINFRGTSDTETIVELFALDGWEALTRLDGMFALAIWFHDRRELLLARDGGGIKPLFYSIQNAWLTFASEIPTLFASSLVPPAVDLHAVSQYVRHAQPVLGSRTLWQGVVAVPPGGWVRMTHEGTVESGFHWRTPVDIIGDTPPEDVFRTIRDLLHQEVEAELRSDVPVGAYLSGGVDSTILLYELTKTMPGQVRTFGIGFEEKEFDERRFAELAARALKVNHTQLTYRLDDYVADWASLVARRGMPLTVPNEPPLLRLAQVAASEVKVVLSGEGSDELYGGYPMLMRAPFDYYRSRMLLEHGDKLPHAATIRESLMSTYGKAEFRSPLDHFLRAYRWIPLPWTVFLFGMERAMQYESDPTLEQFWFEQFERTSHLRYDDQIPQLLWNVHLPGLLGRIDATTMAASIEGRVPFVGRKVVEHGMSISSALKLKFKSEEDSVHAIGLPLNRIVAECDIAKHALREAYRGLIPESIRQRRKTSFPVPLESWFRGQLRSSMQDRLMAVAEKSRWFDPEGIELVFAQGVPDGSGIAIWMALNLAMFFEVQQSVLSSSSGN